MIPVIETKPLIQLASGDWLSLQVYKFKGQSTGKKAYLQSNLHGAELAGNAVIHQLIEWLMTIDPSQLVGEIWLVPVCNPFSVNQRSHFFASGRYNSYDGKDWNRIFWDYAKESEDLLSFAQSFLEAEIQTIQQQYRQRIQACFAHLAESLNAPSSAPLSEQYRYQLQLLCLDADYVIDLHTSAGEGIDYLFYFPRREAGAAGFLLPVGVLLDRLDGDAFDEAFIQPWIALENCFAQLGRIIQFDVEAYTLELGTAMQLKPKSVAKGVQGVKNYLTLKGMFNGTDEGGVPLEPATTEPAQATTKFVNRTQTQRYYAAAGGMIQALVPLGCYVKAGQCLYQILSFNKKGQLPTLMNVPAEQDGFVFDLTVNQAVNQGEYVLGLLPLLQDGDYDND